MVLSRSRVRSVMTCIDAVSIGNRRMVASEIRPVSPMPPAVAQNTSGSRSALTVRVPSAGVSSTSDSTWEVNVPS